MFEDQVDLTGTIMALMPKELVMSGVTDPGVNTGIRLAIRKEGSLINVYIAGKSMEDADLIGSIHLRLASDWPDLFERWESVFTEAVSRSVEKSLGVTPTLVERPVPQHEKSGSA